MSSFAWTTERTQAAVLLAESDLSDREIAQRVGVAPRTLARWKLHPDFAARVGDHIGQIQASMLRLTIAKKHERLTVLDDVHRKLLTVIDERAAERLDAPGAGTGLVVRQVKQIGAGRNAEIVEEFAVDAGVIREIRALHEQAAKELGQWVDKSHVEGATTVVEIVGVDAEAI